MGRYLSREESARMEPYFEPRKSPKKPKKGAIRGPSHLISKVSRKKPQMSKPTWGERKQERRRRITESLARKHGVKI